MFKKINGFNDYLISEKGEVIKLKKLKKSVTKNGYVTVTLNGKQFYLHRLLWETFNGEISEGYEIDHIDTNKENNKLENLRLVTHKENCNNEKSLENYYKSNRRKAIQVYQYSLDGILIKIWPSINECRKDGFEPSSIVLCCHGKRKKHKGYKWSFI